MGSPAAMNMSPHGLGANRHLPPMHQGGMGDMYSQNGMYSQGMRSSPMDMYRMQQAAGGHSQAAAAAYSHYGNGSPFNGASVNLTQYQRQAFGYGM
jgi:hypothetical protein